MTNGIRIRPRSAARHLRTALGAGLLATTLFASKGAHAQTLTAALHGCGDGGILTQVETIEIIYWTHASGTNPSDPSTYDDTYGDARYVASYMSGLLGSTYTDTLTQYYEDLSPSCLANGPGGTTNSGPSHLLWSHANRPSPNIIIKVVTTPPPSGNWAMPSLDDEHSVVDALFPAANAATNSETNVIVPIVLYSPTMIGAEYYTDGKRNGVDAYHDRGTHGQAYISMPYQTYLPSLSQYLTHEYEETVTAPHSPPDPAGWYVVGSGELADLCEDLPTRRIQVIPSGTLPSSYSQIQPFWSRFANHGLGACVYSWARGYDNFYVGSDGAVYAEGGTNNTAARWGVPTYGGKSYTFTSPPSAVVWGGNHFDVVAMDSNDHISELYSYDNGGTISTYDWGAPPNSAWMGRPDVASWGNHREDLFAASGLWYVAGSPAIYHRGWDNQVDGGWQNLGTPPGGMASNPTSVAFGFGNLAVFVLGQNGAMWQNTSTDGNGAAWSGWKSIGKPAGSALLLSDPDVASWGDGRIDLFTLDSNSQLAHYYYDSSYNPPASGWGTLAPPAGYTFVGSPSAVGMGDHRFLVTVMTTSGAIAHGLFDYNVGTWTVVPGNWNPIYRSLALAAY